MKGEAATFAELWLRAMGDRGEAMRCNEKLVQAAQNHADYLAERDDNRVSMHVGRNGSTPNQRVRATGYRLPDAHGDNNTVESACRTPRGPAQALRLLLDSKPHRAHLLREGFFAGHVAFGVGYAGPKWFVIVTAPPEGA